MGLTGVCVPEEYGGAGMDGVSYCLVVEELSRVCAPTGVIVSVNNSLVCDPLLQFGSEEQKRAFSEPRPASRSLKRVRENPAFEHEPFKGMPDDWRMPCDRVKRHSAIPLSTGPARSGCPGAPLR